MLEASCEAIQFDHHEMICQLIVHASADLESFYSDSEKTVLGKGMQTEDTKNPNGAWLVNVLNTEKMRF